MALRALPRRLGKTLSNTVQQASGTSSEATAPALSELRPQIETAVIQQKQQQVASQLLQQAQEGAAVEVLIEGVSYPANAGTNTGAAAQPAVDDNVDAATSAPATTQ